MRCHVEVSNPPAIMCQHDKDEQDSARDGWYGKEINRGQGGDVIVRNVRQVCEGG